MNPVTEERIARDLAKSLHPRTWKLLKAEMRRRLIRMIPPNATQKQIERAFNEIKAERRGEK